jgi:endonuclease G
MTFFKRILHAASWTQAALLLVALLSASSSFASATQGKPNTACPQFAPHGFPFSTEAKVASRAWHICHQAYSSYLDPVTRTPLWSAELLDGAGLGADETRTNDFRPDPDIPRDAQARSQRDFARSGYDQGHLSPAGDFRAYAPEVMSESFYYSNIVPQDANNNRHAWQKLEIFTRQWAQARGKVYVVTGPLYSEGKALGFLGDSKLAIPTHLFKVVFDYDRMEALAFVLPNKPIVPAGVDVDSARGGSLKQWEQELSKYIVSVRDIEAWSGLRFDAGMAQAQRDALHSAKSSMWSTRASRKRSKNQ